MRMLIGAIFAIAVVALARAEATDEVRVFFGDLVKRTNAFDVGVAELYSPDAKIITLRDGDVQQEMTGSQWKEFLSKVMPIAMRRGDTSTFTDVQVVAHGDGFRLTAIRTSVLKCSTDRNYHLDVAKISDSWRVVEEYTETKSLSQCKPSTKLAAALAKVQKELLPHLPIDLDGDTKLESVDVVGSVLIYSERLHTITAAEMDLTKLVPLLQQIGVQDACGRGEMRALISDGATISYSFVDRNGQALTQINIYPGLCS